PGGEVVQEALQRVLVRLDRRTAQRALEQRGDKLHDEHVRRGVIRCHAGSPFASDDVLERLYHTPRAHAQRRAAWGWHPAFRSAVARAILHPWRWPGVPPTT